MRIVSVLFIGAKECAAPTHAQSQNQMVCSVGFKIKNSLLALSSKTRLSRKRTHGPEPHNCLGLTAALWESSPVAEPPWYNCPLKVVLLSPRGGRL